MLRPWFLVGLCLVSLLNCGEPVLVDCTPDEEECTTENEGGFEHGAAAGIAAGVAVIAVVAEGGVDDGEDGSPSSVNSPPMDTSADTPTPTDTATDTTPLAQCSFHGSTLESGQSVIAYEHESVPYGQSCASQTRSCNNGTLNGSYAFPSCQVAAAADCTLNDISVANGTSITAYEKASVGFGESCSSQTRTCSNGALNGSYPFSNCTIGAAANCSFLGESIAHGTSLTAYAASSVSAEETCLAELRSCQNGILSGSHEFANCTVESHVVQINCSFNGQSIPDGTTVAAYVESIVPYGSTCNAELRSCDAGLLSGSNPYSSCTVAAASSCSFHNLTLTNGASVTAYQSASVPFDSSCTSQQRTCHNGTLSGSYTNTSCSVNAAASCSFHDSAVEHGNSVTAYLNPSEPYGGSCTSQPRSCNNGVLSGSYTNASCSVESTPTCTFNRQILQDGATITAYQSSSVPFGSTCVSQIRTCSEGSLSGSYAYGSCSVRAASNCSFNGQTILHGSSVSAYETSSVPFGSTCASEQRTCGNGMLSGSYRHGSCQIERPTCTFDGQTVPHGNTVIAYLNNSEAFGRSCTSQIRTCFDGNLSGSYRHGSCEIETIARMNPTLAAGTEHTCVLLSDQTVQCWGANYHGQLGDGTNLSKNSPTSVATLSSVAAITAGNDHTCALLSNGTVQCWGDNLHGQLGDGTNLSKNSPTSLATLSSVAAITAGGEHTCALLSNQRIQCWGYNSHGQLGDGTNLSKNSPTSVATLSSVAAIAAGGTHTCALLSDHDVQCWGANYQGQLGNGEESNGSSTPTKVKFSHFWTKLGLAAGSSHSCALLSRSVTCWGANRHGQIGKTIWGSLHNALTPEIVSLSAPLASLATGSDHTCALLSNQVVKCWGSNQSGQLGDGNSGTYSVNPVTVIGL